MTLQAAGEKAVRDAFPKATIFKPGVMVGVEDRLFNTFAQTAKRFPFVPLINGGSNRLQPVWVRDVSGAIVSTLNSRQSLGETYHLAGPEVFTCAPLPCCSPPWPGCMTSWHAANIAGLACCIISRMPPDHQAPQEVPKSFSLAVMAFLLMHASVGAAPSNLHDQAHSNRHSAA